MKIVKNAVPVEQDNASGEGIVEIVDVNINNISGVLIQNNCFGKFVEVYDKDGNAIFKSKESI